ncbi:MAG: helix-turn-helix domain-containing protein, partial [Candidatus Pacebacteria bacterium]|nr:helix-turn-helix domain-containing protein [Candidatus Paceibacterota bacterium]
LYNIYIYLLYMNKYIQKIKEFRLERGFSQDQIAKAIGVSRPTYTAIESGKQELSLEEAKKLATLFGIGVDELLSGSIPNIQKYKHMILTFLRTNVSKDGKIPKTKLAKLLYLADFAWFYHSLESMSGMQYRKIVYGLVPDIFFRVLDELEEDGKIIIDRKCDDGKDMFLVSESESNKNEKIQTISTEEKDLMKKIAERWKDKKTQEIVNFTHNQLPYSLCRENELIPYELITQEDPDSVY